MGKTTFSLCREFKIHDSHLKPDKYVEWVKLDILS